MLLALTSSYLILAKNPIAGVLSLILIFINAAIILITINANLLALLYIVVYVGAISVLFLFVIMLLNLRSTELANRQSLSVEIMPALVSGTIFLAVYTLVSWSSYSPMYSNGIIVDTTNQVNETSFVTIYLFQHPYQLVLLTILLFLGILSPIIISTVTHLKAKKQDLFFAYIRELRSVPLTGPLVANRS